MGNGTAMDLAFYAKAGIAGEEDPDNTRAFLRLDQALTIHLQSNNYPPLPLSLLPTCHQVIDLANNGEFDGEVELPAGITYKGNSRAPVRECIQAWHLDAFIDYQE